MDRTWEEIVIYRVRFYEPEKSLSEPIHDEVTIDDQWLSREWVHNPSVKVTIVAPPAD
jgi:hypothetical protein